MKTGVQEWLCSVDRETGKLIWNGPGIGMQSAFEAEWEDENGLSRSGVVWTSAGEEREAFRDENGTEYQIHTCLYKHGTVTLLRQVKYAVGAASAIELRLTLRNAGEGALKLRRLVPLLVQGAQQLQIGDVGAGGWTLYKSGRQKNDLPAVCALGVRDEAYQDAVAGMSESGRRMEAAGDATEIVSDELSVIVGGRHPGSPSLLIGFVDAVTHLAECRLRVGKDGSSLERLEASCLFDGVRLEPGDAREGGWLRLDAGTPFEAVDEYVRAKRQATGTIAMPNPPSVYCTWYYYGDTVSQDDVYANVDALQEKRIPIDVVQIDEGWEQRFGNWGANHRFPDGMEAAARRIREAGYRPGIWTAPFLVEPRSDMRFYHDEWLLRGEDGEPVKFYMNNTDNLVWDVTHPEVLQWIEELYAKLTAWGYTYHKLDFTRAVALDANVRFYREGTTRAEAYRMGIEAVRRGIGPEGYLLLCGGLYSPPSGLADAHRTSSDVLSMWSEHDGKQGGQVAPFTMKQNTLRYWMGRLWHNDPDALMVRRQAHRLRSLDLSLGKLTDDEARVTALNQYWGGGLVCFSEPMNDIDDDRLGLLRHIVPSIGIPAVPRDMYAGVRYPRTMVTEVDGEKAGLSRWHTVSIVNWDDDPAPATIRLEDVLPSGAIAAHESFYVSEFWSGEIRKGVRAGEALHFGVLPPHASLHLKIVPASSVQPVVAYTNGHFSMGAAEITRFDYDGDTLDLHVDWPWEEPLAVVLLAPDGCVWSTAEGGEGVDAELEGNSLRIAVPGRWKGPVKATVGTCGTC
ncbi:MAG TPA: glycoside hydrolase family 36 protein [Paenibacillus sp.]|nr:glycoside hydrolase family 36 protein [Paenibacillus sp.]